MTLNDEVGNEANLDTASVSQAKAPEEVTPVESTEETTEVNETGDESKRSAKNRIRELDSRAKRAEERAKSLEDRLAELTGRVDQPEYTPAYNPQQPIVAPGEEIDAQEFEQRVVQRTRAEIDLKLKQQEAINRINSESGATIRKYPELDPDSESFNKDLSDSIVEAAEAYVKANPYSASVSKFVDKLMKPYKRAIDKEVGQANENIAKQVSQAALRPTPSVKSGEKANSEKSIADLEKELGVRYY